MAPRKMPAALTVQASNELVQLVQNTLYQQTSHYYVHDEKTNQVTQYIRDEVKEAVQRYMCEALPADVLTTIISSLLGLNNAASPHLVLDLLVNKRLKKLTFELTQANHRQILTDKDNISRVSEDDISKCLKTLACVFEELGSENMALEQIYIIDKTQDPDFQGDPINNMNNTNLDTGGREGDWAGIMSRLTRLSQHLAQAPWLTRIVLPFASDQILSCIANAKSLRFFQNVYRSTITETGMLALAEGSCKNSLTHIVLSLNTHANIPNFCITAILRNATKLRVFELGGSKNTKSLYFQGGDAKRRNEIYKMICQIGETEPTYTNQLSRLFIFKDQGNTPLRFHSMVKHCPRLTSLTLFGWEHVRVERSSWLEVSRNLTSLEVIGMGFVVGDTDGNSPTSGSGGSDNLVFDHTLLASATKLSKLKIAGWGDTEVDLYSLLETLPGLEEVYLEDLKIKLEVPRKKNRKKATHKLTSMNISHCSTLDVNLIQVIIGYLPKLTHLSISSLYMEDPSRGLPFHFHLPQHEHNSTIKHPVADLKVISELRELEQLHLNVNYPADHQDHDFALPVLLIRGFPKLQFLHLDNYITRRAGILSYTFDRVRSNNRLQWFLNQYNRNLTIDLN